MKDRQRRIFLVILALLGMFILTFAGCKKKSPGEETSEIPESGDEAGTYYYDAGSGNEYLITLGGQCTYTLTVGNASESGSYTLDGATLTLKAGDTTRTADWHGNELTLDYDGSQLRFLRKVDFTVSFDSLGGSAVGSVTVLNGKTISAPQMPTREGFLFLGWYSDADYKAPFVFDATPVTSDLTLRARWAEKPTDALEYRIRYDLGYDGETLADAETIGEKFYNAAVPAAREGYRFVGWWVSMTNDANKLSYRLEEGSENGGTVFGADTTLFAVWQKTNAAFDVPAVSVSATAISWDSVGATAYLVKLTAPDGSVVVDNQRTTSPTFPISLAMAGEYRVEVTAVDAGGNAVSETAVRYYTNKGLNRVGGFTVIDPSVLVFRGVPNAEKYLITVDCGNPEHTHKAFDNGLALYFNFANCEMKKGGITFTVTAVANGYASSTVTYTYERNLDAVKGLKVQDDILTWNPVSGATFYWVTVGDETFTVLGNSFSLSAFKDASYSIGVTPVAHGFNSSEAATLTYEKKSPALPEEVRLIGTVLTWDAVPGATSYEVKLGDKTLNVAADKTELDLADAAFFAEGSDYTLTLKVTGASGSAEKVLTVRYNAMNPLLTYSQGILRWSPVVGAVTYEVQMNGVTVATIDSGDCFYRVNRFSKSGENTVRVRFNNGVYDSEWAELTVVAHKVTLDGRGGNAVESLYKAVGDPIDLPSMTKNGYNFSAWYNLPNGAESNGRRYSDVYFVESGETVLYAYYTPKAFTIHYNTGDGTDETDTVYFGKNYQLKVPTVSVGTRAFGGWFSAPYGAGIAYTDAEGNSLNAWNYVDDNVTVYAFWVDSVLRYEKIGNAYAVSKGARIDLVSSVTIPAKFNGLPVTEIISGAFEGCKLLTEIRLPDTLTRIAADTAFEGCDALKSVTVYKSGDAKYARYSSVDGVLFDNGESGSTHAPRPVLMPSAKTGTYTVPGGVDVLPRSAFANSKLSKIILPISVKEIGVEAFANCTNLVSVVFEDAGATVGVNGLTIGDRAFLNCTGLTVVTLPARLQSISLTGYAYLQDEMVFTNTQSAFEGCENLTDVVVAKGQKSTYTSVDGVLLGENGTALLYFPMAKSAEGYEIPAGVTKIGDSAFLSVSGLRGTLELPGRVTSIGTAAFAKCRYLTAVTFKSGISKVEIGDYAFYATDISEITFEDGSHVTKIGKAAFKKDDNFDGDDDKTLVIPSTVTSVGDEAFSGFGVLDVEIKEGTEELAFGNNVFYDCEVGTLTLPKNVTALANFFTGLSVEKIVVNEGNKTFISRDGVLYTKDAQGNPATLLIYPSGKDDTDFTVPDGVTAIADGAFKGNEWLENVTLPASLTSIGKEAFSGCKWLEAVTFGQTSGTLSIGEYAFYETGLEKLELPQGVKTTIGAYAFAEDDDLATIKLGGTTEIGAHAFEGAGYYTDIEFPASLETIGDCAFKEASISSVTFEDGSKLKTIGGYAFSETKISEIVITGSVESIGAQAFSYCESLKKVEFMDGTADLVIGAPYLDEYGNYDYGRVFYYYSSAIETLNLPARLTVIYQEAFSDMRNLKTVTFGSAEKPSRLTTIGEAAFKSTGLTSVTIPKSVRNTDSAIGIGKEAFAQANISTLIFEAGGSMETAPLTIGESAFADIKATTVTFPARLAFFTDANGNVTAPLANGKDVFSGASSNNVKFYHVTGDGKSAYVSEDGILYNADKTEIVLCGTSRTTPVVIPATVKTIAAGTFKGCAFIPTLTFAQGSVCTEIGAEAFSGCKLLTTVALPNGITTIGEDAFYNCSALTAFTLPASLEVFDPSIISYCTGLQNLYVANGSKTYCAIDGVLFTADKKTLVFYLASRTNASYEIPNGTVEIADSAFNRNSYLQKVTIPNTVMLIGNGAFSGCRGLTEVNFAAGGTDALVIGYGSFSSSGVTSIRIPARTKAIEGSAFSNAKLASLTFENGSQLTSIADYAFSSTALTAVALPTSLRELGESVFSSCKSLKSAILPEGLLTVDEGLFDNCPSLVLVSLPSTLQTLGNYAFRNCVSLKNVNFAKNSVIEVLYIGTFYQCDSLESIELPASLTEIPELLESDTKSYGLGLFYECGSLKRVVFEEGSKLTKIGSYAFSGTVLESINFPSALASIGKQAFEKTNLTTLTIPVTVTSIGENAFDGCKKLTSVTLGAGVKVLPSYVFQNCDALTTVNIPASLISIDSSAFVNCDNLIGFTVDRDSESFMEKDGVVYDINWNIVLYPMAKTEFEIPAGMTKFPENFFDDYNDFGAIPEHITVEEGNTAFKEIGGILYDFELTEIVFFPDDITEFTIPEKIPSSMAPDEFFELLFEKGVTVTLSPENTDCKELFGVIYFENEEYGWLPGYVPADLTEFKIPKEVTFLYCGVSYYGFFRGRNSALKTVTYEERTEELTIYGSFFSYATNLETVSLPEKTTDLSNARDLFSGCTSLREVNLPASLTALPRNLGTMSALERINVASGNKNFRSIDGVLYQVNGDSGELLLLHFPATKTTFEIPKDLGGTLSTITAPNLVSVTYEKDGDGNEAIGAATKLTLSNGSYSATFRNLAKLETVELPSRVENLVKDAFVGCDKLTSLTVAAGGKYKVDSVGVVYKKSEEKTGYWRLLFIPTFVKFESFEIPADVSEIAAKAFADTGVVTITFAARTKDQTLKLLNEWSSGAFANCKNLTTIVFPDGIFAPITKDGVTTVTLPAGTFYGCSALTSVTLPADLTEIGENAFYGCSALETLTLPSTVTKIGDSAFYDCTALTTMVLPAKLEEIGSSAFAYCTSLTKIVIPASVKVVGSYAFSGWKKTQTIYVTFAKDALPEGFNNYWLGYRTYEVKVEYNYKAD